MVNVGQGTTRYHTLNQRNNMLIQRLQKEKLKDEINRSKKVISRTRNMLQELVGSALDIALMVTGVVLQQPPISEAPASHHFPTYDTKSSAHDPLDCCPKKVRKKNYSSILCVCNETIQIVLCLRVET